MVNFKRQHILWLMDSSPVIPKRPYMWQREKEKIEGMQLVQHLEEQYVNKC